VRASSAVARPCSECQVGRGNRALVLLIGLEVVFRAGVSRLLGWGPRQIGVVGNDGREIGRSLRPLERLQPERRDVGGECREVGGELIAGSGQGLRAGCFGARQDFLVGGLGGGERRLAERGGRGQRAVVRILSSLRLSAKKLIGSVDGLLVVGAGLLPEVAEAAIGVDQVLRLAAVGIGAA
jgi:hypothetical protein